MIGARIASAPAVLQTPFGNVFAVVRTEDNRIFQSTYWYGPADDSSGWSEAPGGGLTPYAPAVISTDRGIYVAVVGMGGHGMFLQHFQLSDGIATGAGQWTFIAGDFKAGPELAYRGSTLTILAPGLNRKVHWMEWDVNSDTIGRGWAAIDNLTTSVAVAAAWIRPMAGVAFPQLVVVGRGDDRKLYEARGEAPLLGGPVAFSGWKEVPGGGLTDHSPAMATFGGSAANGLPLGLHLVVRGILDGVAYQTLQDDKWSSAWSVAPAASTDFAPEIQQGAHDAFYVTAKDRGLYYQMVKAKGGDQRILEPVDTWRPVPWSIFVTPQPARPDFIESGWRWCRKCQSLWSGRQHSVCQSGGSHSQSGSQVYALVRDFTGSGGQSEWRRCSKCQSLWYSGNGGSVCPAGGQHSLSGSPNYSLSLNDPTNPEQGHWRWCSKCQGLFFGGSVSPELSPSVCQPIVNAIKELETDKKDLQAQLQEASSEEKPALVAAITNLTNQINTKEAQLAACVNANCLCAAGGSHSGGFSGEYRIPQMPKNIRLHFKILTPPKITPDAMLTHTRQLFNSVGIGVELVSTETLDLPTLTDLDVGSCFLGQPTDEQNQLFGYRNNAKSDDLVIYFVRFMSEPFQGCASHPAGKPGAAVASEAGEWVLAHEIGHVLGLQHPDAPGRLMTYGSVTNPPPDLIASEVSTMKSSALTVYV